MQSKYVIGLMSGTSADGIDASLLKINENFSFENIANYELSYEKDFRQRILDMFVTQINLKTLCEMNVLIGEYLAKAVLELCKSSNFDIKNVDIISSHGQTIFHNPTDETYNNLPLKSTLQIGELSVIAKRTGVTTIGDFRDDDIASGGQGAPLVPFFDNILFSKDKISRAIQNLGGIGNVTVISPNCDIFAFDTGPANVLIDYFAKKLFNVDYDKDGNIAFQGKINAQWLNFLMNNEYFEIHPPKSTGRELFNYDYAENALNKLSENTPKEDIITTVTEFTVQSIKNQYEKFVFPKTSIKEIVLGGGGAFNLYIKQRLYEIFDKQIEIKTHEDFGVSNKFKEAIAFAILGYARFYNIPNNIPSCTGAKNATVMGKIVHP